MDGAKTLTHLFSVHFYQKQSQFGQLFIKLYGTAMLKMQNNSKKHLTCQIGMVVKG